MAVVSNTVLDGAGLIVSKAPVLIELVTGLTVGTAGYMSGATIGNVHHLKANRLGVWSIDLPANDNITPANTYYRVSETVDDRHTRSYDLIVPTGAGPFEAVDLVATSHPGPDPLVPVFPTGVGVRFDQVTPASTWVIPWSGRVPSISLYVDNYLSIGDVEVVGSNLYLTFPAPTAGFAILV